MPELPHVGALVEAERHGVTARELLARRRLSHTLTPNDLETWMLEQRLATNGNGLLHPTPLTVELTGALTFCPVRLNAVRPAGLSAGLTGEAGVAQVALLALNCIAGV